MQSRKWRSLLPYLLPVVAFAVIYGVLQRSKHRAEERITAANPLPGITALRGKPILLLTTDLDQGIPARLHAEKVSNVLGATCTLREYPAMGLGYAYMFDRSRVLTFLKAKTSGKPTLFLLHGIGKQASSWNHMVRMTQPDRTRVDLADALRKAYSCKAVELGAASWGNDASVAALDRRIGDRKNVVLVGETMGALTMWRWAERHPTRVAALIGILPVCDLTAVAHASAYAHDIRRAYGSL